MDAVGSIARDIWKNQRYERYYFITPTMILLFAVYIFPLLYALFVSFHDLQLGYDKVWIGLENFKEAFMEDERFKASIINNLIIAVPAIILEFFLGFGYALLLNKNLPGRGIITGLLVAPVMVAPVMVGMSWRMLYGAKYGALNNLFKMTGLITENFDWFADAPRAISAIVIADVWWMTPFVMMILLAGLQAIPVELYEAATVDGASRIQNFFHITLPLLKYPIIIVLIMRFIEMAKLFGLIYILTWGGPGGSTETVSFTVYLYAFDFFRIGYSSALSYIILVGVLIMTLVFLRIVRIQKD